MAEPNAALPTNQSANLVNNLTALLQTFGGTKTTSSTNPGETDALRATLAQLQGADYQAMLQSIFQQAGGQIPGIQTAMGNAIGARSGGNSAVAAALQKLLQQTTIAGQEQIAKQQLANQQTQVQAGQAIAQATRGTQTTEQKGTNLKQGASNLAQAAALTQLLGSALKLTGKGTLQEAFSSLTSANPNFGTATPTGAPAYASAPLTDPFAGDTGPGMPATYTSAELPAMAAPVMQSAPVADINQLVRSLVPAFETTQFPTTVPDYYAMGGGNTASGDAYQPAIDFYNFNQNAGLGADFAQYEVPQYDFVDYGQYF